MPTNENIRQKITDQIITAIENGVRPWRRPWSSCPNAGRPMNVVSKKPYSGINPLLLEIHRLEHGFTSRWYATFKQWKELGFQVKQRPDHIEKGDWGSRIIFYSSVSKRQIDSKTGEETENHYYFMKTSYVFSADQVEGAEQWQSKSDPSENISPDYAPAENLIKATNADIRFGGNHASYMRPSIQPQSHYQGDYIVVPPKERFSPVGSYYETLFHELAHWSEIRLGWDRHKHGYAMGELIAEMAASFLGTELRIPYSESLDNHAAYLKSWLDAMENDAAYIFKASNQASKVCDFLLSFQKERIAVA